MSRSGRFTQTLGRRWRRRGHDDARRIGPTAFPGDQAIARQRPVPLAIGEGGRVGRLAVVGKPRRGVLERIASGGVEVLALGGFGHDRAELLLELREARAKLGRLARLAEGLRADRTCRREQERARDRTAICDRGARGIQWVFKQRLAHGRRCSYDRRARGRLARGRGLRRGGHHNPRRIGPTAFPGDQAVRGQRPVPLAVGVGVLVAWR